MAGVGGDDLFHGAEDDEFGSLQPARRAEAAPELALALRPPASSAPPPLDTHTNTNTRA
jgi:hypothetical protein